MKKMIDLFRAMVQENDEIYTVCAYAFFVDTDQWEQGMERGISDFDAALIEATNDDEYAGHRADYATQIAQVPWHCDYRAAVNAISLDRTLRHALNERKVALYTLYAQRIAVLKGEAPIDSLLDYARRYDTAFEAYLTAHCASAGRCEDAKRWAERVEEADAY